MTYDLISALSALVGLQCLHFCRALVHSDLKNTPIDRVSSDTTDTARELRFGNQRNSYRY